MDGRTVAGDRIVIMVPCTWVVETEVFIYRFRKHDNRQWEGLRREHEPGEPVDEQGAVR